MGTKENIKDFGDGTSWVFDGWTGRVGGETFPIMPWYAGQCDGPGDRSISGPHRATPEAAEDDARRMAKGDAHNEPYEVAYVTRYEPAVRISIDHDVDLSHD